MRRKPETAETLRNHWLNFHWITHFSFSHRTHILHQHFCLWLCIAWVVRCCVKLLCWWFIGCHIRSGRINNLQALIMISGHEGIHYGFKPTSKWVINTRNPTCYDSRRAGLLDVVFLVCDARFLEIVGVTAFSFRWFFWTATVAAGTTGKRNRGRSVCWWDQCKCAQPINRHCEKLWPQRTISCP